VLSVFSVAHFLATEGTEDTEKGKQKPVAACKPNSLCVLCVLGGSFFAIEGTENTEKR
jgi:hypothetical protein